MHSDAPCGRRVPGAQLLQQAGLPVGLSVSQEEHVCNPACELLVAELEGLIRNGRFRPFTKHVRVPPDAKSLIRALLVPVDRRPTAEELLRGGLVELPAIEAEVGS